MNHYERERGSSAPLAGSATIIPFPLSKRIGKARRVARLLASKTTSRARAFYWQQVLDALAVGMRGVGIDDFEIDRQLRGFSEAVTADLGRLGTNWSDVAPDRQMRASKYRDRTTPDAE